MPVLAGEWALGRALRGGPVPSFRAVFGHRVGAVIGTVLLLSIVIADSYYIVIIANIVYTAGFGLGHGFGAASAAELAAGLDEGENKYVLAVRVLAARCAALALGVRDGTERGRPWFGLALGVVVLSQWGTAP